MDKTELGCLRAIVLFNPGDLWNQFPKKDALFTKCNASSGFLTMKIFCWPADAKGLSNTSEVELLREKVYASLEAYCKQRYPEQQGR